MGRQAIELAGPAGRLFLHDRHTGAIHLDIENGDRFTHDEGQIQLECPIDLLLLAPCDIGAGRFGHALDGFSGEIQAGQQLELLAAMIERSVLPHQCLHPAHTGRELRVHDVEIRVGGELPLVAVGAKKIGTRQDGWTQHGEHRFGAQLAIACWTAAPARNTSLLWLGHAQ